MTSRQESVHLSPVNRQAYAVARDSTITAAVLMLLLLGMTDKTLTTATTLSVTRFQHWSTNYRISVCPSACLCAWIWRWTSAPHPVILFRVILWWVVSIERSACSVMVNKRTKSINNAPRATAPNVMGKFKWQNDVHCVLTAAYNAWFDNTTSWFDRLGFYLEFIYNLIQFNLRCCWTSNHKSNGLYV